MTALPLPEQLRIAGCILDAEEGTQVSIRARGDALILTWLSPEPAIQLRTYPLAQLAAYHPYMQRQRQTHWRPWVGHQAELLRTLGQLLEVAGIAPTRITEQAGGYQVLGQQHGQPVEYWYARSEMRRASMGQLLQRLRSTQN